MAETELLSLWGECGEFAVPGRTWLNMLTLARWYGWQPAGTTPPSDHELGGSDCINWKGDPSDWGGLYFPAEGQWITEPDARALAAALTRALLDVPEHDARSRKAVPVKPVDPRCDTAWGRKVAVGTSVNPFEEFSGPNKPTLGGFITHCRDCSANGGLWLL